ncbi:MAG: ribosome-associated translation inhibitor RaiA [bacterium]|nr:ribosome-associated translation inhibitor RaiA [bacterium]
MKINIKATNLDLTPAIRSYIEEKIGSLEKYLKRLVEKGAVEAFIEIARITKHHQKGPVFKAECNLELPGKLVRAEHSDWNIRRAVDEIKKELQREVSKYKERVRPQDSKQKNKLRELRGK